jgi:hypothetical protein
MRTYILSLADITGGTRRKFRCQASSLAEAIENAQRNNPGFFAVLKEEAANASVNH